MKALKIIIFLISLICSSSGTIAQSDTAIARRALLFADSLVNAFRYANWTVYLEMTHPGIVGYYGGKKGFGEYIHRIRTVNSSITEEAPEKTEIIQIASDSNREWQCVVKKTRDTRIDGKKAFVISYMVGQSKDAGLNWKYFDVAYNSVENVVYIMPDIFDTLVIPQRHIVFQKDELATAH